MKTKEMKKISIVPQPYQRPYPPISQVVDGIRSIEWAAKNGIKIIMWIPPVKALKIKFEAYKKAKSEAEKRDVPLGEGVTLCLRRLQFFYMTIEINRCIKHLTRHYRCKSINFRNMINKF
jgi:hypothetical protein